MSFESMLAYIRDEVKPDLLVWTGDTVPHYVWGITNEFVVEEVHKASELISQYLLNITVIYPVIGNHDSFPFNNYKFESPEGEPSLQGYKDSWEDFIDEDAMRQISQYGFYSTNLKLKDGTVFKDTKIISLNSVACYKYNAFILDIPGDPGDQLEWLINELDSLEKINGKALIISHIPNLEDCEPGWGLRYHAILERYQHVVRLSMYGHTHSEQFQITKGMRDSKPLGFAFLAGSGTPNIGVNSGFNVLNLDIETMLPMNIFTHSMNLQEANANDKPEWKLIHDYLESYGVKDLSPSNMMKLAEAIRDDEDTALKYYSFRSKLGPEKDSLKGRCD